MGMDLRNAGLGNQSETEKGRPQPPFSPRATNYLLFAAFFFPYVVSTLEPMLANRSLADCA
jgi:hypothetical protein